MLRVQNLYFQWDMLNCMLSIVLGVKAWNLRVTTEQNTPRVVIVAINLTKESVTAEIVDSEENSGTLKYIVKLLEAMKDYLMVISTK